MGEIMVRKGDIWDHSLGIRDHKPLGSGSAVFRGMRDQAVPFLWDQRPTLVPLLESRIRNLGTKMGSTMKKHTLLRPYQLVKQEENQELIKLIEITSRELPSVHGCFKYRQLSFTLCYSHSLWQPNRDRRSDNVSMHVTQLHFTIF